MLMLRLLLLNGLVPCFLFGSDQKLAEGPFAKDSAALLFCETGAKEPNLYKWNNLNSVAVNALACTHKPLRDRISQTRQKIKDKFKERFEGVSLKMHTMTCNSEGEWCVLGRALMKDIVFFGNESSVISHQCKKYTISLVHYDYAACPMKIKVPDRNGQCDTKSSLFCFIKKNPMNSCHDKDYICFVVPHQSVFWYIPIPRDNPFEHVPRLDVLLALQKTIKRIASIPGWLQNNCVQIDGMAQRGKICVENPVRMECANWSVPRSVTCTIDFKSPLFPEHWWDNVKTLFDDSNASDEELLRIADEEGLSKVAMQKRIENRRSILQRQQLHAIEDEKLENKTNRWIQIHGNSNRVGTTFNNFAEVFKILQDATGAYPEDAWNRYRTVYRAATTPLIKVTCTTFEEKLYAACTAFGGYHVDFTGKGYSFLSNSRPMWVCLCIAFCGMTMYDKLSQNTMSYALGYAMGRWLPIFMPFFVRAFDDTICSSKLHYSIYTGSAALGLYGLSYYGGGSHLMSAAYACTPFLMGCVDAILRFIVVQRGDAISIPLMDLYNSWPMRAERIRYQKEKHPTGW